MKDFTYITHLDGYTLGAVVKADGPFKSWKDVIDFAKADLGKFIYLCHHRPCHHRLRRDLVDADQSQNDPNAALSSDLAMEPWLKKLKIVGPSTIRLKILGRTERDCDTRERRRTRIRATMAKVPAANEPSAAMPSAGPRRAPAWPSRARRCTLRRKPPRPVC